LVLGLSGITLIPRAMSGSARSLNVIGEFGSVID